MGGEYRVVIVTYAWAAQMFLRVGVQHGSECHIHLGSRNDYPDVSGDCHIRLGRRDDYPDVSGDCHIRLGRRDDYPDVSSGGESMVAIVTYTWAGITTTQTFPAIITCTTSQ